MPSPNAASALRLLAARANSLRAGFPIIEWTRVEGPGPDVVKLHPSGGFEGIVLQPGTDVRLRCELHVPAESAGVALHGDSLQATLFTIFPTTILADGRKVFEDDVAPVASGPALVHLADRLGDSAVVLDLRVHVPNNQITPWLQMTVTTPGLRAHFERADTAWAQLALAAELAASPAELRAVEEAAAIIMDGGEAPAGESERWARMVSALAPLSARIKAQKVHLIGHSHIDMNWLWTWPDTVEVIRRDFRSVLAIMRDYPEMTFSHSQPATYEVIRQREPALFEEVLQHIRSGRWEPISMTWVEGDVNMASGEGHARQLLEGVGYTRSVLGYEPDTLHEPDTFGHAGNLPQIAADAGAKAYYHHRAFPGGEVQWPAYWWEGDDGSRLLAICTPTYNGEILARDLANAAIRAHRYGQTCSLHFHGLGDHGGGPARHNMDSLRSFQKDPLLPTAECSTLRAFRKALLDEGPALRTHKGESRTIFEGCYTTHADTKRYNREGENLLCTADTLAALAGQNHVEALQGAWRKILFNQFHDILDGSAIHESYEQNRIDFEEAAATAQHVIESALPALRFGVEGEFAITNPLAWEREDWVVVPGLAGEGAAMVNVGGELRAAQYTAGGLGFVARVPAFGTIGGSLAHGTPATPITTSLAYSPLDPRQDNVLAAAPEEPPYITVETPFYRASVRRDCGIIVSLFDKRASRQLVGYGMRRGSDYADSARPDLALNVMQIVEEHPHPMTAWHYDEVHSEKSLLRGAKTTITESGPARVVIETTHTYKASTIVQRTIFYQELERIDFEADVDWQELGSGEAGVPNLKVAFTARLDDCEAWFETPFAAVKRPSDGQEVPALRWADVGGDSYGIALLNDSKYGYDALGCRLRLTLLRSAYDPDAISDAGRHSIRYSLLPHLGDWRGAGVVRAATGYNQPLIGSQGSAGTAAKGPELRLSGAPGIQIACLKVSSDGAATIIRLYESAGRAGEATLCGVPEGAAIWESNVLEDRKSALPAAGGRIALALTPWQVRTLRIEAKG